MAVWTRLLLSFYTIPSKYFNVNYGWECAHPFMYVWAERDCSNILLFLYRTILQRIFVRRWYKYLREDFAMHHPFWHVCVWGYHLLCRHQQWFAHCNDGIWCLKERLSRREICVVRSLKTYNKRSGDAANYRISRAQDDLRELYQQGHFLWCRCSIEPQWRWQMHY